MPRVYCSFLLDIPFCFPKCIFILFLKAKGPVSHGTLEKTLQEFHWFYSNRSQR